VRLGIQPSNLHPTTTHDFIYPFLKNQDILSILQITTISSTNSISIFNQTIQTFPPESKPTNLPPTHATMNNNNNNNDTGATGAVKGVTSLLGNTVGGLTNTVGGVVGALGRGLGETVNGATGGIAKPVGDGVANLSTGVEQGAAGIAKGVKDAGQWKSS
jgi:hypothetical protein